jgi:hypothetical protein
MNCRFVFQHFRNGGNQDGTLENLLEDFEEDF